MPPVEIDLPKPEPAPRPNRRRRILPGFHLTLGFTIFYLSAIVLIPLMALLARVVTPNADYPTLSAVTSHVVTRRDQRARVP